MKLSDLRKEIDLLSQDEIYQLQYKQMEAYLPLFSKFIEEFLNRSNADEKKRERYRKPLPTLLEFMDSWYFQRIKYVKARRNEIENSISFIRNTALNKCVSDLRVAGVARNFASYLRGTMRICDQTYKLTHQQHCDLYVRSTFELAFVKELFPIDTTNLFYLYLEDFNPTQEEIDDFDRPQVMLNLLSKKYGFDKEVLQINKSFEDLWIKRDSIDKFVPDKIIWNQSIGSVSAQLHYGYQAAFHTS